MSAFFIMQTQSTLVLNGKTGYPVNYAGLKKTDYNFLKNINYLQQLKTNDVVVKRDKQQEQNKLKTYTTTKDMLLKMFQLRTINSQSVVQLDDLLIFAKKDFAQRLRNIQLKNDCICNATGKHIIVVNWRDRRKYISFSWLLECLVSGYGGKYFHKSWLKKIV